MLSKHGYHGGDHLGAMLRYEMERTRDTEYIATILWSIGRLVGGNDYPMPSYEDVKHPKPNDIRTKKEIVNSLIDKLKGGDQIDGTVQSSRTDGAG